MVNQEGSRFLTGPNEGEPEDIAISYMQSEAATYGLSASDVADLVVRSSYASRHNDVTHVNLAGVILHEYSHGISLRLTGGPGINCLPTNFQGQQTQQMGEGWSDYHGIATLMDLNLDHPEEPRGMGPYILFQDSRQGAGIRPRPYSRNMFIQPATYDSIKVGAWLNGSSVSAPHGIGHIWAAILWDMTWDLVEKHGFNPDVYGDWSTGGNNLAQQLVIDGLKLQGCFPGFVQGRDAILAADEVLTGGENACTLWATFSRRGLGHSAEGTFFRASAQEAFDTHPDCARGFRAPVLSGGDDLNVVAAESTVPLRFELGGNQGLDILASNSPFSRQVDCETLAVVSEEPPFITPRARPIPTETAGNASLSVNNRASTRTRGRPTLAGSTRAASSCSPAPTACSTAPSSRSSRRSSPIPQRARGARTHRAPLRHAQPARRISGLPSGYVVSDPDLGDAMTRTGAPRILIAGGGYVGLYAALRLERVLAPGEADLALIAPESHMTFLPLLPEVTSGTLEPRHAVVPLRAALKRTEVVTGRLAGLDHEARRAHVEPRTGTPYDLAYDHVVIGLGSVTRLLPVPGLTETAIGFQTLAEAIHLRNQVLGCLEAAAAARDADARRRALTFVFVGAGYTGVEVVAELEDMARTACSQLPTVTPDELRWVLVEATDRILPTVEEPLSLHALHELRARGIEVRLETTLESCEGGRIELSDGEAFESDTLVWMAGIAPHGLVAELGLPVDGQGRLVVDEALRADGTEGAWGAGDCAAVPDGEGGFHPPTAQNARAEGDHIGSNIARVLRGGQAEPFRFTAKGEFVTLGNRKGVGELYGRPLRGLPVWLLRRVYYALQIPTLDRKVRIALEWLVGLVFRRDVVSLGSVEQPRRQIEEAAEQQRGAA